MINELPRVIYGDSARPPMIILRRGEYNRVLLYGAAGCFIDDGVLDLRGAGNVTVRVSCNRQIRCLTLGGCRVDIHKVRIQMLSVVGVDGGYVKNSRIRMMRLINSTMYYSRHRNDAVELHGRSMLCDPIRACDPEAGDCV